MAKGTSFEVHTGRRHSTDSMSFPRRLLLQWQELAVDIVEIGAHDRWFVELCGERLGLMSVAAVTHFFDHKV
jgi:hypothetical protein